MKEFSKWHILKSTIESRNRVVFCKSREIWWASLGQNIGSEQDGKNDLFERPVLIMKVYNNEILLAVPISTKKYLHYSNFRISINGKDSCLLLQQARVISSKRLIRKVIRIEKAIFKIILELFVKTITPSDI